MHCSVKCTIFIDCVLTFLLFCSFGLHCAYIVVGATKFFLGALYKNSDVITEHLRSCCVHEDLANAHVEVAVFTNAQNTFEVAVFTFVVAVFTKTWQMPRRQFRIVEPTTSSQRTVL